LNKKLPKFIGHTSTLPKKGARRTDENRGKSTWLWMSTARLFRTCKFGLFQKILLYTTIETKETQRERKRDREIERKRERKKSFTIK